jgi:recombination protein RecA
MKLGEQAIQGDIAVIPTGSLGLDLALGVGGLPRGRVVEIYGPDSWGKTTLALECIAEAQKRGGVCAFIDAEHALDANYARKLGVSVEGSPHLAARQRRTGARKLRKHWCSRARSTCS